MKKFLFSILSIVLAFTLLLSGCGATMPLSFNNAFNGGGGSSTGIREGFKEVLTYDVTYLENYDSYYKKSDLLTDSMLTFSYQNGTYVTEFSVVSATSSTLPEQVKSSEILSVLDNDSNKMIYCINTELNIDVVANVMDGKGDVTNHDFIKSTTYFLMEGHSFAPIYSVQTTKTTFFTYLGDSVSLTANDTDYLIYEYGVVYDKKSYTINKKATEYKQGKEPIETIDQPTVCEYEFKRVIDNGTLLFALRNLTIESESSTPLPTASPSYQTPKSLTVTNHDEFSLALTVNYNGEEKTAPQLPVKKLGFVLSDDKNKGAPQYAIIQSAENGDIPFRSLLVEYVQPLTTYGTFVYMGALKYTLKSVEI